MMHDKVVRRRRAVLAVLVLLSLFLLTAYFGESSSGALHAVQRGAMEVLAPIQEGANRALKPFRDLFGWFGDTLDAKEERDGSRPSATRCASRSRQVDASRTAQLQQIEGLQEQNTAGGLDGYEPVEARVIARSPSSCTRPSRSTRARATACASTSRWSTAPGWSAGSRRSPTATRSSCCSPTPTSAPPRRRCERRAGQRRPRGRRAGDLRFELVPNAKEVRAGERIVTAGTSTSAAHDLNSLFPRGIPIGTVSRIEIGDGELDRGIHVKPAADLRSLDLVEVLTEPHADVRAQAP